MVFAGGNVDGLALGAATLWPTPAGCSSWATPTVNTAGAFAYETVALAESGALWEAAANVAGSLAVRLLAAAAGFGLALL